MRAKALSSSRNSRIPAAHRDRPVVFSAHGVPKSVPADAEARNLAYLDANVPGWSRRFTSRRCAMSVWAVMSSSFGHAGPPEVIGTMGQLPDGARVTLVETEATSSASSGRTAPCSASSPRRRSPSRTRRCHPRPAAAFPGHHRAGRRIHLLRHDEPGRTRKGGRSGTDLFLVVGAPNSSNSRRLVEGRSAQALPGRCSCSARPEIPWIRSAGYARSASRRRVRTGDHRRRDSRRVFAAATRWDGGNLQKRSRKRETFR